MSDLAATNCGGGCSCNEGGCNSILWIIILLCCCGGNGGFCGGNNGCGGSNDCLWIILLLFCCGGCGGMAEDASASLSIHSIQAAGIAGRPVSFYCLYQKRLCPLQARRFLPSGQDSFLIHRSSIL